MADQFAFAVIGSGVMGGNLALNIESHGFPVVIYDVNQAQVKTVLEHAAGHHLQGASSLAAMVAALSRPRRILLMVPAGPIVDASLKDLLPLLDPGDVIIDGGNSYFEDTARRVDQVEATGRHFIGMGTSGGAEGALTGPSLMPGGSLAGWPAVRPVLEAIAAKAPDGTPCCRWIGPGGAGHFVKMVHNGIEYADMQAIGEAYFLLSRLLGLTALESSDAFQAWHHGELESYLIEITARLLRKADPETGRPMVESVLDHAEQKGTGAWTAQAALELGVPTPTIDEAVSARSLSALKEERLAAAQLFGNMAQPSPPANRQEWLEKIRRALYVTKICVYAQGFALMRAAGVHYNWNLNLRDIAAIWRAGCIIRAGFLERIMDAYAAGQPTNLLRDDYFTRTLRQYAPALRETVCAAASGAIWAPCNMSALAYFDGYSSERLPANLLQVQRDYFGAHTFERNDKPGHIHLDWDALPDLDAP